MVTTPIDPRSVPTINLSETELAEMQAEIDAGLLPPDFIERHLDAVDANVFGIDAPKDKNGNRQEQGRGSSGNQTKQSIDAYKKWGRDEPDFERTVARMEKELVASDARRKVERDAARKGRRVL
jgi:hypothetical protein